MPISAAITQRIEQHLTQTGMCIANLVGTSWTPEDVREAVQDIGRRTMPKRAYDAQAEYAP